MTSKHLLAVLAALALPALTQAADPRIDFTLEAAKDLRDRARFPEWSQPVVPGAADPLLAKSEPTRQSLAGPGGAAPTLSVWASAISGGPGETVDLYAQLINIEPDTTRIADVLRVNRDQISATISAQLLTEAGILIADLPYADDGRGPDLRVGDGIYSARLALPKSQAPALGKAQSVMVKVRAHMVDGQLREAVGGFQYSNPGARLTGRFRDLVRDGNLVLQAEVEVLAPGRYHLSGTVADLAGSPRASAQSAQSFSSVGKRWLELSYYGLIFHDRGTAGQLRLVWCPRNNW